jgi:hypothetical protein
MQFCGDLPLLSHLTDTHDCNPQRSKTAVDPRVGVWCVGATLIVSDTPPQGDEVYKGEKEKLEGEKYGVCDACL